MLTPSKPEIIDMTSSEIADLAQKEHSHVLRDIRVMIAELLDDPDLDHVECPWNRYKQIC